MYTLERVCGSGNKLIEQQPSPWLLSQCVVKIGISRVSQTDLTTIAFSVVWGPKTAPSPLCVWLQASKRQSWVNFPQGRRAHHILYVMYLTFLACGEWIIRTNMFPPVFQFDLRQQQPVHVDSFHSISKSNLLLPVFVIKQPNCKITNPIN